MCATSISERTYELPDKQLILAGLSCGGNAHCLDLVDKTILFCKG